MENTSGRNGCVLDNRSCRMGIGHAGGLVMTMTTDRPDPMLGLPFSYWLDESLEEIREMLLAKNRAYGNSALDPVRVFSSSDTSEQLRVRLDDKISRIVRGQNAGEDVATDLLGYLIILRIAEAIERERADG